MNPPYSEAWEFVIGCTHLARVTIALLRLGYLASMARKAWLQRHPPSVYVLSRRPSFTGGGTDATDYGWFVWGDGNPGRLSVI